MNFNRYRLYQRRLLSLLVVLVALPMLAVSQPARIKHKIEKFPGDPPGMGREMWFTMAQNYENGSGKYYELFVTSPNATRIYVQVTDGVKLQRDIQADEVAVFDLNLAWEVKTSGVVERKGIRVWSETADLSGYLLSRNPATSDGMFIIPTIGWGTEYVVAAYATLYANNQAWDYPSEFVVVANQDGTNVEITPTTDIRGATRAEVLHPKNIPFQVSLKRGECIQFKAATPEGPETDFSGTIVRSNKPIGVVGASQCPYVPIDFQACDHLCDMVPPIRTWAKTYYSAPYQKRKGGDTFKLIGSSDNQTIWVTPVGQTKKVFCRLNKYETYEVNDVEIEQRWESDDPFLLVQYENSSTWAGGVPNYGDPNMTIINGIEQWQRKIVTQTPTIVNGRTPFENYANVFVHSDALATTTFDGRNINSLQGTRKKIDNNYTVFKLNNVKAGTHTIISTEPVGVYIYGRGWADSYAWVGTYGSKSTVTSDTIPPDAIAKGVCFDADVDLTDIHDGATKLGYIRLDSVANMIYNLDPDFIPGAGSDKSFYRMSVEDIAKDAYLQVSIYDIAGNRTTVTSTYQPLQVDITPQFQNYGTGNMGGPAIVKDLTIRNSSTETYDMSKLQLRYGNVGFTIVNADMSPLPAGQSRVIQVSFIPLTPQTAMDWLEIADGCEIDSAQVVGSGGQPDFVVTDVDFKTVRVGNSKSDKIQVEVRNLSDKTPITITDIVVDNVRFTYTDPLGKNFVVAPNGRQPLEFTFSPIAVGPQSGIGTFTSAEVGSRNNKLLGVGVEPSAFIRQDTSILIPCPEPGATSRLTFRLRSEGTFVQRIQEIKLVGDPEFDANSMTLSVGGTPVTTPFDLQMNEEVVIQLNFVPQSGVSRTYAATLTAFDDKSELIDKTINMNAKVSIVEGSLDKATTDFGTLPFGSAKQTDTYVLTNNGKEDLIVTALSPDAVNSAAFSIAGYSVNGTPIAGLPVTLASGDKIAVQVSFDPSAVPTEDLQIARYFWTTNVCTSLTPLAVQGKSEFKGGSVQGFKIDPIFACATASSAVNVTSSNDPRLTDEVVAVRLISGDMANFVLSTGLPVQIQGGQTKPISFTFAPNASSAPRAYAAVVEITYRNAVGEEEIFTTTIEGSAVGMTGNVTSQFATVNRSALSGTEVTLPIDFTVSKNGIADDISASAITGVRLEYLLNADLIANKEMRSIVNNLPADWQVITTPDNTGLPSSRIEYNATGADRLILLLQGNQPLTDAVTKLGDLVFTIALPKEDNIRELRLDKAEFLTINGVRLSDCFGSTTQSGEFQLIYACGDKLIQDVMNNKRTFASIVKPVTPNPVVGSKPVTFTYALRAEAPVSLTICDMLGNEVARVVDGVKHSVGVFEVSFDAGKLSSGNYICRFDALGTVQSENLVVNR